MHGGDGTTARAGPGLQQVCCDGAWRSVQHKKTARQGVRVANWVRELIIGIETVRDRRKPKYAINRTILDKNFHKQLILRYIGRGRP